MSNCEKSTTENVTAVDQPMNQNPIKRWLHKCDKAQIGRLEAEIRISLKRTDPNVSDLMLDGAVNIIATGKADCYAILAEQPDGELPMPIGFVFAKQTVDELNIVGLDRFGTDPVELDEWIALYEGLEEAAKSQGVKRIKCKTPVPKVMQILNDCGFVAVCTEFSKEV